MPPLETAADRLNAMDAITSALSAGDITINEALQLSQVVEIKMNVIHDRLSRLDIFNISKMSDADLAFLVFQSQAYEERKKLLNNSNNQEANVNNSNNQETNAGTMRRRREAAP
jgi:hypothetical protein